MKKRAIAVTILSAFALSHEAFSVPFHGCTLYKSRLVNYSWPGGMRSGCADFSTNYGACTKVKCFAYYCVEYSGVLMQGWLPEYFVEVTPHMGNSAFSDSVDSIALRKHMEIARNWWKASRVNPLSRDVAPRPQSHDSGHEFKLLYARALSVPYGTVGWSIPMLGSSGGSAVPACFKAISELTPQTWMDDFSSGDRKPAALWSPFTPLMCNGLGAAIQGGLGSVGQAVSSMPIPTGPSAGDTGLPGGCALPLPTWLQTAKSITGADTSNPQKQCMGSLGPLLPRTGWVEAPDMFTAGQQAAWRLASLAQDQFGTGIGVEPSDKWQVVWPPTATANCFAPGSLTRPNDALPNYWSLPMPLTDGPVRPSVGTQGASNLVFAIWKKHSTCLEPWEEIGAQADLNLIYGVRRAACSALNTADGMP